MDEPVVLGAVIIARLPVHQPTGHEQLGPRPVIVVGIPGSLGVARFPMVLVTPVTSDRAQAWAAASPRLYPKLPAEAGGLPTNSIALLDQTRALDARRLDAYLGTLTVAQFRPIREGLLRMLGFRLTSTGRR